MNRDEPPTRLLKAGVSRAIITPPVGIRMAGYTVQECVSESVERELTATALVLSDGQAKVVLIACDLLFIQSPHVDPIRTSIGRRLGIPDSHVLINCSHTHLAPMFPGWQPDTPEQERLQRRYLETLEESLPGVAAMADRRLQPARIGAAKGHAAIGVNRRERLPDGRIIIGKNPNGAVDHEVGVIRVDSLDGKTMAVVMTAAAHPIVLGPKTSQLSPDYVGPAREMVESATGGLALFMQGAAGNVCPISGIGRGGPEQYEDRHRVSAILAGEAIKTWAQIRTHNQQGPRQLVQSVAAFYVWDYEPTPENGVRNFAVAERRLSLALAPLPDRVTAERNLEVYRQKLVEAQRSGKGLGPIHVAQRLVHWAENVLRHIDSGENPVRRELVFWALRINDIGIVAVSGEPFAELSLEVKRCSPLPLTFFLGYSNGCVGYLPTPEAFDEGGMEVNESVQNYLLPARLTKEWGPAIVQTSLELLGSLKGTRD